MRSEEFNDRLRRGAADVGGQADPAPAGSVRRRGDRRRQRNMLASGVVAFVIGAGGGGYAYASISTTTGGNPPVATGATQTPRPGVSNGTGRPDIVAVTTAGAVEVLNSVTGIAGTALTGTQDAVGDEIAVSPDGSTAYFAVHVKNSCADDIESVPLSGGTPTVVTTGVLPAISPDGADLAFVREQFGGGVSPVLFGCGKGTAIEVGVLDLATHQQTWYPAPPANATLVSPISHLSWSPDGTTLLVSSGPVQDNEGWTLSRLDVATARYYLPENSAGGNGRYVPVAAGQSAGSYFEEGVYLPGGNLFVDLECCSGVPVKTTSSWLLEVSGSGTVISRVAQGWDGRIHSSLDAVPGWQLYLSGTDLFIVPDGQKARTLSSAGFIAAAWVP
jgi:hypothetical protein